MKILLLVLIISVLLIAGCTSTVPPSNTPNSTLIIQPTPQPAPANTTVTPSPLSNQTNTSIGINDDLLQNEFDSIYADMNATR